MAEAIERGGCGRLPSGDLDRRVRAALLQAGKALGGPVDLVDVWCA
jgi:hypothetical protein